mmetsp:Transcript_19909/g.42029  ORF Transcript_19909/g.42029 Transcript_19909/m.42029 type:complete len:113 (-) Transcript_19909:600-938(-)
MTWSSRINSIGGIVNITRAKKSRLKLFLSLVSSLGSLVTKLSNRPPKFVPKPVPRIQKKTNLADFASITQIIHNYSIQHRFDRRLANPGNDDNDRHVLWFVKNCEANLTRGG